MVYWFGIPFHFPRLKAGGSKRILGWNQGTRLEHAILDSFLVILETISLHSYYGLCSLLVVDTIVFYSVSCPDTN
jgi:hypothetical protein